jgi:RNA polymerase sigma factor for flagellar operon FliA
MRELLADAIADLPERERLVFTLYYYEELETLEIALVLGETPLAVLQLHASALGGLKLD